MENYITLVDSSRENKVRRADKYEKLGESRLLLFQGSCKGLEALKLNGNNGSKRSHLKSGEKASVLLGTH